MRGALALAVIFLELYAGLMCVYIGIRIARRKNIVARIASALIVLGGGIFLLHTLISNSFGLIDRAYLRSLKPEDVRTFYIGNTIIDEPTTIRQITNALSAVQPCFPTDTINPIDSFAIFEHVGYRWYRIKYWKSDSRDEVIIFFGRGRDGNILSQIIESYGCSRDLANTLRDLGIQLETSYTQ